MGISKKVPNKGTQATSQTMSVANAKSPNKITLTIVTDEERKKYRVPVYDYIL